MARSRRRRPDSTAASGSVKVQRKLVKSGRIFNDEEEDMDLEVEVFETDPAYIRISHGATKSIGDYESLRVDVAITVPCYPEAIDTVAKDLGERVAVLLEDELDEYGVSLRGS